MLVRASDDTDTDILSGSASLGVGVGFGTSMGATLIDKDTQAWIGAGATVDAGAGFADTIEVAAGHLSLEFDPNTAVHSGDTIFDDDFLDLGPDHGLEYGDAVVYRNGGGENLGRLIELERLVDGGTYFVRVDATDPSLVTLHKTKADADTGILSVSLDVPEDSGSEHRLEPVELPTRAMRGVAVQALSTESTFTLAASGAVGLGGLTGNLVVVFVDSDTAALSIRAGAAINTGNDGTEGADQSVNVAAVNRAKVFDAALNLNVAFVSLAGSVDLGMIRNDTSAWLGAESEVLARGDLEVYALAGTGGGQFRGRVGAVCAGFGLSASAAIHSIGAALDDDSLGVLETISGTGESVHGFVDAQIALLTDTASGGVAGLLSAYASQVGGDQPAAERLEAAAPSGAVSAAVTDIQPGAGTTAIIDGATVSAGGDVEVAAVEKLDAAVDTSFTLAFGIPGTGAFTFDINLASVLSGGNALAQIRNGADIFAGGGVDVRARGTSVRSAVGTGDSTSPPTPSKPPSRARP